MTQPARPRREFGLARSRSTPATEWPRASEVIPALRLRRFRRTKSTTTLGMVRSHYLPGPSKHSRTTRFEAMVRTDVPPAAARAPQLDRVTNNPDSFSRGHSLPSGAADNRGMGSGTEAPIPEQGSAASAGLSKDSPPYGFSY